MRSHSSMWGRGTHFLVLLISALILAGCDSLSSDVKKRAENAPKQAAAWTEEVNKRQTLYNATMQSDGTFLKPYADREKWAEVFTTAQTDIKRAKELGDGNVKKYLTANKSVNNAALKGELDAIDTIFKGVDESTKKIPTRISFLKDAKTHRAARMLRARDEMTAINAVIAALMPVVLKAQADYPLRTKDIADLYARLTVMQDVAKAALAKAEAEHAKVDASDLVDYAVLGDNTALVAEKLKELQPADKTARDKVGQLYRSYTKILADMKVEYWVTIGRTSWDESLDWATEHPYTYAAVEVDEATYTILTTKYAESSIATLVCFFGCSASPKVDKAMWAKLGLESKDKYMEKFPRGDNEAEYWLADGDVKYFHKYTIVANAERTQSGWEEVDEEEYKEYADALGMEIESKPYGYFDSEIENQPAPPGMSLVGNPKYGEWRTNATTGQRQWSWLETYAFYHLIFGGSNHHYYSGSDHDDYRKWRGQKDRDGYYGGNSGAPIYGTHGTATRSSTTFGQSTHHAQSGGFKQATPSARSAGPSNRTRGPGGRGK